MPLPTVLIRDPRPHTVREAQGLLEEALSENIAYTASPVDWRDEVLYFLLPDRFSDGAEAGRPLLARSDIETLRNTSSRTDIRWDEWAESGTRWQGGTLNGIASKLDYLAGLGVTALWIGPVFKQRARLDTYHGYGIQDFLEVDPRFGNRSDFCDLVQAAHAKGLKVILDVIINHSGDNWGYVEPGKQPDTAFNEPWYKPYPNFYGNPNDATMQGWTVAWRDEGQRGFTSDASQLQEEHEGVWPLELQTPEAYTRAGKGSLNDNDLGNPHAEHKRTDFDSLKDFALDAPEVLTFLSDCFKYWIAITDCDGFRIDTVKHISLEDGRNFCGAILEFAESIGKRNFFLVGEIAGGDNNQDFVMDFMQLRQRNLKAALDIGSDRINLHFVGKGLAAGEVYFDGFQEESNGFDSHRSFGSRHVSVLDDHDHVFGEKLRFSATLPDDSPVKDFAAVAPTAIQLFALGVPCIYYGTEQAFAGPARSQLPYLPNWGTNDRYLREAMFGPEHPRAHHWFNDLPTQISAKDTTLPGFGAFGTSGKHCFDTASPAYVRIAALARVRKQHLVLRVGRQYQREVRVFGQFSQPPAGEIVAWSRILDRTEALCVVNPNGGAGALRGGDVVVSSELCAAGDRFVVVANSAQAAAEAAGQNYSGTHPVQSEVVVAGKSGNEPAFLSIRNVAPCEVLVLLKQFSAS